jgi:hypothetical protein
VSFYEKGPVRIHFEEKGSGFPLLMIAGGGLNSAIPNLSAPYSPFNAMDEFKYEYRCIGADLRNAARCSTILIRSIVPRFNFHSAQIAVLP